jgi:hypothetical protein
LYAVIAKKAPDKSELEIAKLYKRAFVEERRADRRRF